VALVQLDAGQDQDRLAVGALVAPERPAREPRLPKPAPIPSLKPADALLFD
jgi:hypothetical protein